MLSKLFWLTSVLFVLTRHATGQNDFVAQASGGTDIKNLGSGNGVLGLALTLAGSAGADIPVSTLSTTTTSADTQAPILSPTAVPTTSATASLSIFSTITISTTSLGLGSYTSTGFTPATATAPTIFEGTASTRPFPPSLPTSENSLAITAQASEVFVGSGVPLASINTVQASPPPFSKQTKVGKYYTGRVSSTGSALIYASVSGGSQWATGTGEATGLPITNVGSTNNVSWTFSKSGMTLAPTNTPTPKDAETKRSVQTRTPTITEYAHTTGIKSSTSTGSSTHADTSGFPSSSALSRASMGSTAMSPGPSAFTGVADKTLHVPFAWSSILMLAGMALVMF